MSDDTARITVRVVDVYPYRIRDHRAEFLLLRRSAGKIYAGTWRVVGGKVADKEHPWQAALREFAEETGLSVTNFWALPSPNIFYEWEANRLNVVPAFAVETDGEPSLDDEHDASEWLSVESALKRINYPEQRRLIHLVEETLARGIPPEWAIQSTEQGRRNRAGSG